MSFGMSYLLSKDQMKRLRQAFAALEGSDCLKSGCEVFVNGKPLKLNGSKPNVTKKTPERKAPWE